MTNRLLTSVNSGARPLDIVIEYDDRATVNDLIDQLVPILDPGPGSDRPTLLASGREMMNPNARIVETPLRSGEEIQVRWMDGDRKADAVAAPAQARIRLGSGEESVVPLHYGINVAGRDDTCELVIDDPLASRRHLSINVGDVITVSDLGSTNGSLLGGAQLTGAHDIGPHDEIQVGDSIVTLLRTAVPDFASDLVANHFRFNRPPRVVPPYRGLKVTIKAPPSDPPNSRFPLIAAVIPVVLALGLWLLTKNIASLAFMAMTPVMMAGRYYERKRGSRADHEAAVDRWRAEVAREVDGLEAASKEELVRRNQESPDFETVRAAAVNRTAALWERGELDPDFLEVRLGMASLPTRSKIDVADGGEEQLRTEIEGIPSRFATVDPVPLTFKLRNSVLGIAGDKDRSLVRSVIALTVALHTPAELSIALVASEAKASEWDWARWLPHVHDSGLNTFSLATRHDNVAALLSELERTATVPQKPGQGPRDVLLIVDESVPADRARLIGTLRELKGTNVSILWVAEHLKGLPRECEGVALVGDQRSSFSYVAEGTVVEGVRYDSLTASELDGLGRDLVGTVDASYAESDNEMPDLVTLGDLLGGNDALVDPAVVRSRWDESASSLVRGSDTGGQKTGLRAAVGIGEAVVALDLRSDGPHALVAGTTGSGKSEFLQTWVTTMAASHSPDRLTFLFVDYKGGSAFQACTDLPHAVGIVTDLDTNQVRRALVSLRSELHRRELILEQVGEKDLISMEEKGHPETPPSLIIVVDEFAALAKEVPEFVEGIVDIAARGRSLGLHLILATQRPAGVITDNIRANTNLRVALRMADEAESTDVVGSKDAAHFLKPGKAIIRTGPGRSVVLQSGFAGADSTATDDEGVLRVAELGFNEVKFATKKKQKATDPDAPKDIDRIVRTINAAFAASAMSKPAVPWRAPLWAPLALEEQLSGVSTPDKVYIGIRDEPENRAYSWVSLDPDREGSWLIVGTGGSGKTTLLRTLTSSLALGQEPERTAVYGLDFGGRGLAALDHLPIVGSIIDGSDQERVTGLFTWLEREVDERAARYAREGVGSYKEYHELGGNTDRRIFVLLDGIQAFIDEYSRIEMGRWPSALQRLVASGRSLGIHFVLTADRRTGIPLALMSNIQRTIVLRMASQDDYGLLSVPKDMLSSESPSGRGIDLDLEIQVAVFGGTSDAATQIERIQELGSQMTEQGIPPARPIGSLPPLVRGTDLPGGDQIELGIGGEDLALIAIPSAIPSFCIFGESESGKTAALLRVASETARVNPERRIYLVAPKAISAREVIPWSATAYGAADGAELIDRILDDVTGGDAPALFIDDAVDLLDTEAGAAVQKYIEALRLHDGSIVIAAGSWLAGSSFHKGLKEIRAAGWGMLLQPDLSRDGALFNLRLPVSQPGSSIPGRGFIVRKGALARMQVATINEGQD